MRRIHIVAVIVTLACFQCADAQQWRVGAELTGSLLLPHATLSELPTFPTCCQTLNPSDGWAAGVRAVVLRDVMPMLSLEAQVGASYGRLRLARTESIGFALDGTDDQANVVPTLTETSLSLDLASIEARVLAAWRLTPGAGGLHIAGGIGGYVPMYARLQQSEQLITPSSAVFSDTRTRERLVVDASVNNVVSPWLSAQVGVGTHLSLMSNLDLRARVMAEVPLSVVAGSGSRVLSIAAVRLDLMALWHGASRSVDSGTPRTDTAVARVSPVMEVTVNLIAFAPSPRDTLVVRVVEQYDLDIHALLPFVFFDVGSAQIPTRYSQGVDASTFHERSIVYQQRAQQSSDAQRTLAVYYHILDVVGRRLRDEYPQARLTVAGYVDGQGIEAGNQRLARRRAETVAQYLVATWGIDSSRIDITSGLRSPTAAITSMPDIQDRRDGYEENRRVELSSTIAAVLDPVVVADTSREVLLPVATVSGIATDIRGATWSTWWSTERDSATLINRGEMGDVNDWIILGNTPRLPLIDSRFNDISQRVTNVKYSVEIRRLDQVVSASDSLPIRYDVSARRRHAGDADSSESRFMLTQFEYGTGRMLAVQSSIIERFINPEITPRTSITITGFTDRKGDAQRNAELSVLRAREASTSILGGARRVIRGEGEAGQEIQPPFTNMLPEMRLYNRTVEIRLRTPMR